MTNWPVYVLIGVFAVWLVLKIIDMVMRAKREKKEKVDGNSIDNGAVHIDTHADFEDEGK